MQSLDESRKQAVIKELQERFSLPEDMRQMLQFNASSPVDILGNSGDRKALLKNVSITRQGLEEFFEAVANPGDEVNMELLQLMRRILGDVVRIGLIPGPEVARESRAAPTSDDKDSKVCGVSFNKESIHRSLYDGPETVIPVILERNFHHLSELELFPLDELSLRAVNSLLFVSRQSLVLGDKAEPWMSNLYKKGLPFENIEYVMCPVHLYRFVYSFLQGTHVQVIPVGYIARTINFSYPDVNGLGDHWFKHRRQGISVP